MTIAALLDLGVPRGVLGAALAGLELGGYRTVLDHAHKSGIVATSFDVLVDAPQPERTYGEIDAMLCAAKLDERTRVLARAIFRRLGEAEASVHRMPLQDVHFHEVGAVDAIIDIVGAAAALAYLDAEVVCSPLPMGRGFVKARHGILPLPAPATVSCLRGAPTYGVELDAELVTPTGAAIVATVASRFSRWPDLVVERVGFGAGKADFPDRPNLLRVVHGRAAQSSSDAPTHSLLETNVDDLTGELAGHAIAALIAAGAVDAWAQPITMKKGRPALVLSALARREEADRIAEVLLRETTSLGVRRIDVHRRELARRIVTVETEFGPLPVKVSGEGEASLVHGKPELDACAEAARKHGVPLRLVVAAAHATWLRGRT